MNALQIPAYATFIQQRDLALERLLTTSQKRITATMRETLHDLILAIYPMLMHPVPKPQIQIAIAGVMEMALHPIVKEFDRVSTNSHALSMAGEAEALGRLQNKKAQYNVTKRKISVQTTSLIHHFLAQFTHRIVDVVFMSNFIAEDEPNETIKKVVSAFPSVQKIKKVKKALFKQREAASGEDERQDFSVGSIDESTWNDIVSDYLAENIPSTRGPEDVVDKRTLPKEYRVPPDEQVYGWSIERQLTEEFVKSVREGQVEAAKQNGIEDFIWIAVLDQKTCEECCEWRDGLTITEIEQRLDDNDDGCDGAYPPAHFNCRCRIAPVVADTLEDTKTPSNAEDFESWLKS